MPYSAAAARPHPLALGEVLPHWKLLTSMGCFQPRLSLPFHRSLAPSRLPANRQNSIIVELNIESSFELLHFLLDEEKVKKSKGRYSSSWELHLRAIRDVTCHLGSHSVTCHPTQVNAPRNCISFRSRILAKSAKLTFSPCVVLVVAFCYLGHPKNLLVRERSALADPYCHLAWNSVCVCVCVCVCVFVRNFEVKYLGNQRC